MVEKQQQKPKRIWLRVTVGLVVAALVFGVGWFTVPYETTHSHATTATDLSTSARAAGWADDIFVGVVEEELGVEYIGKSRIPKTLYRVKVQSSLKGELSGVVRVAQSGGDDRVRRQRIVFDEAPLPEVGKTYVFATRVDTLNGWHGLPMGFTPAVQDGPSAATEPWTAAVAGAVEPEHDKQSPVRKLAPDARKAAYEKAKLQ